MLSTCRDAAVPPISQEHACHDHRYAVNFDSALPHVHTTRYHAEVHITCARYLAPLAQGLAAPFTLAPVIDLHRLLSDAQDSLMQSAIAGSTAGTPLSSPRSRGGLPGSPGSGGFHFAARSLSPSRATTAPRSVNSRCHLRSTPSLLASLPHGAPVRLSHLEYCTSPSWPRDAMCMSRFDEVLFISS